MSVLALLICLVGIVGYSTVTASNLEQPGPTVPASGYVTEYIDDDAVLFTDGTNTFQLEIQGGSATDIPLNTPVMITVEIVQAKGNGGFEVYV